MSDTAPEIRVVAGPSYDDLTVGYRSDAYPRNPNDGLAAAHQAIVGDRQRLARRGTGGGSHGHDRPRCPSGARLGHIDRSIDFVTQRVIANLFVSRLGVPVLSSHRRYATYGHDGHRAVAGRGQARAPPRGLAVLRVVTSDQSGRPVLDFHRCAMLPARKQHNTGQGEEAGPSALVNDAATLVASVRTWNLVAFRSRCRVLISKPSVPGPLIASRAATSSRTRRASPPHTQHRFRPSRPRRCGGRRAAGLWRAYDRHCRRAGYAHPADRLSPFSAGTVATIPARFTKATRFTPRSPSSVAIRFPMAAALRIFGRGCARPTTTAP